jgi:hypothetical protein
MSRTAWQVFHREICRCCSCPRPHRMRSDVSDTDKSGAMTLILPSKGQCHLLKDSINCPFEIVKTNILESGLKTFPDTCMGVLWPLLISPGDLGQLSSKQRSPAGRKVVICAFVFELVIVGRKPCSTLLSTVNVILQNPCCRNYLRVS